MRHRALHLGRTVRAFGMAVLFLLPALIAACGQSGNGSGY